MLKGCMIVQGLFERHKLVFATQLAMAIIKRDSNLASGRFDLLLVPPKRVAMQSPMPDWLPDNAWAAANALKVSEVERSFYTGT